MTLAIIADPVSREMNRLLASADDAGSSKAGMAVITVAVIILVGQICAARFARIGSIIAIIAHTVDAAPVGKICTAHAALRSIFILAAVAQGFKAVPIPVGSAAGLAQARKAVPAALARSTDQRVRVSVGNAAIIALGKIALILVIIRLMAAVLAISTPNILRSKISAAQRTTHQRRIGLSVTIHT